MRQLTEIGCFILDMDGTFYLGNQLIDGAREFIAALERQNKRYFFLTNNSSKSAGDYQRKLAGMGVSTPIEHIINSGEVAAHYINGQQRNARIYLVGTPSLHQQFTAAQIQIAPNKEGQIDYLVLGFDTTVTYQKLWDAHDLILKGVPYLATNPDFVCPLEEGKTMPDCGSMIALFKTSTGKEPLVIGKPNPLMIDYVAEKFGIVKETIAMVGDRLYTDIQTAINANITGVLVLSGETKMEDVAAGADGSDGPDYIFPSIKELAQMI